jgi:hypothetical protein
MLMSTISRVKSMLYRVRRHVVSATGMPAYRSTSGKTSFRKASVLAYDELFLTNLYATRNAPRLLTSLSSVTMNPPTGTLVSGSMVMVCGGASRL